MNKGYKIQYEKKIAATEHLTFWKPEVAIVWAKSEDEAIASLYNEGYTDNDEPIKATEIQNIIILETWDSIQPKIETPLEPYEEEYEEQEIEYEVPEIYLKDEEI